MKKIKIKIIIISLIALILFSGCSGDHSPEIEKEICKQFGYKYYLENERTYTSKCYNSLEDIEQGNYLLLSKDLIKSKEKGVLLE